jgi:hypothetical protein
MIYGMLFEKSRITLNIDSMIRQIGKIKINNAKYIEISVSGKPERS